MKVEEEGSDSPPRVSWWRQIFSLRRGQQIKSSGSPGDDQFQCEIAAADIDTSPAADPFARRPTFSIECHGREFLEENIALNFRNHSSMNYAFLQEFSTPEIHDGVFQRFRNCARGFSPIRCLKSIVPLHEVLKTYKIKYLLPDLFSGVSEGVMAIPQGMSYSMLARLPPQFGLYVNLIYPLVYMIFGTGRHVAVGVSAIENLLLGESVTRVIGERERLEDISLTRSLASDLKTSEEARATLLEAASMNEALLADNRIAISIGMSVCVGLVFALMRVLQAGLLADLLAVPVLSGFSTASAFLIGTSQLKHALGLSIPATVEDGDFKLLRSIPLPGPLLIVIIFTAFSAGLEWESSAGIRVIGTIPSGFPSPTAPKFSTSVAVISDGGDLTVMSRNVFLMMLREALALTAMFFVIHISIAKTITQQKKTYHIRPDQELVALSCCNFVGSCFQCFPNATSLSRTCVVASTGGFTQLHQISNALVLVFTLSFMTPLLYALPNAVLAAVVLFGVYGMLDFKEFIRLARIGGLDVLLWLVCFLITVIFGAMEGILASILLSLLWLLRKTARPACIVLGRLPETLIYRNVRRFPMAIEEEGIRILRFDASLNFSNSDFFESRVMQSLLPSTKIVIMDCSSINDMDITSIRMLERLVQTLKAKGIVLLFANWKGPMRDFLQKACFYDVLPPEYCFLSIPDAVFWAKRRLRLNDTAMDGMGPGQASPGAPPFCGSSPEKAAGKDVLEGGCATPQPASLAGTFGVSEGQGSRETSFRAGHLTVRPLAMPFFGSAADRGKGAQRSKSALALQVDEKGSKKQDAFRRRSTRSQSLTSLQELQRKDGEYSLLVAATDRAGDQPIQRSLLWDGLSARTIEGLRVVTEITGSGRAVRWTVCTTTQQDEGTPTRLGEPSTPRSTMHQPEDEDYQHFFS
ncbi:hypothetical protein Emag_006740 [Eimeria magna]